VTIAIAPFCSNRTILFDMRIPIFGEFPDSVRLMKLWVNQDVL
jgi:hypothetical protein